MKDQKEVAASCNGGELRTDKQEHEIEDWTKIILHAGRQGCTDVPEDVHSPEKPETDGNGNIHYQLFCGILIDPSCSIISYKIVSTILNETASRLDIDALQEILAAHWRPYLENLLVCMTDATYYESHMRYPADMKLLWESAERLYRHICRHCREPGIRCPRNKYTDVARSYLSYIKKKK